jgi:hypothetical protein
MKRRSRPRWVEPMRRVAFDAWLTVVFALFGSACLSAALRQILGTGRSFQGNFIIVGRGGVGGGANWFPCGVLLAVSSVY